MDHYVNFGTFLGILRVEESKGRTCEAASNFGKLQQRHFRTKEKEKKSNYFFQIKLNDDTTVMTL